MKSILLLLAAAFAPLPAVAQQSQTPAGPATAPAIAPASVTNPAVSPAPAPAPTSAGSTRAAAATVSLPGQPAGPTLEKNIPLIPENAPSGKGSSSHGGKSRPGSSPGEHATFQTENEIRMRIRMREAETRALNDPGIQEEWVAAHHAHTDIEHRALLTIYYNHLYDRVIKLDPSIAAGANARRGVVLSRMKYPRLGDEDNSENPFVAPTPEPSGPNPPAPDTGH